MKTLFLNQTPPFLRQIPIPPSSRTFQAGLALGSAVTGAASNVLIAKCHQVGFLIFKQFHLLGDSTPSSRKVTTQFYWKVSSTVMVFYSGVAGVCLSILSGWVDQCLFKSVCLLAGWMLGCGRILVSTWETQQSTSSHYQKKYLSVLVNSTNITTNIESAS